MKLFTLHLAVFALFSIVANAQEVTKEEIISEDGSKRTITSVSTSMYNGTTSEAADKFFQMGNDFATKGNTKSAIENYKKAIKEDDQFVEAYDNLGRAYRVTNDFPNAIKCYKKSIEIYPDGPMAHQNLAVVYGLQKNYTGAINEYNELIRIDPKNAEGYFGLANIFMVQENFDDALEAAENALAIYQEEASLHLSDGYYLVGLIHFYSENDEEAKKYILLAKENGARISPEIERSLFGASDKDANEGEKTYELKNKEDYALYEEDIVKMTNWLVQTPLSEETELRRQINAFIVEWVSGSPNVSVELSEKTVPYLKCRECLALFMGSWSKYCIENNDYENSTEACYSATKDVITFYTKNKKALGKNKEIEKLIALEDKGELKTYLKDNLSK